MMLYIQTKTQTMGGGTFPALFSLAAPGRCSVPHPQAPSHLWAVNPAAAVGADRGSAPSLLYKAVLFWRDLLLGAP